VAAALRETGYDGWATFEQDRVLATIDDALAESRRSLEHARAIGF
jgi:sugar phosphate isomerase/epimerase